MMTSRDHYVKNVVQSWRQRGSSDQHHGINCHFTDLPLPFTLIHMQIPQFMMMIPFRQYLKLCLSKNNAQWSFQSIYPDYIQITVRSTKISPQLVPNYTHKNLSLLTRHWAPNYRFFLILPKISSAKFRGPRRNLQQQPPFTLKPTAKLLLLSRAPRSSRSIDIRLHKCSQEGSVQ